MNRRDIITDFRTLLRKHAARFVNELDLHNLKQAKHRLEQMLALMNTIMPHDHYEDVEP
jgi:hypothetical protein